MRRLWTVLLLTVTSCATTATPSLTGTFGNVSVHKETGDLGGYEMELHADAPIPSVIFTTCAGGCYGGKSWPVTIAGNTIVFTVVDDWYDSEGKLSDQDTTRYSARFTGDKWILTSPDVPGLKAPLRRVRDALPGHTEGLTHF